MTMNVKATGPATLLLMAALLTSSARAEVSDNAIHYLIQAEEFEYRYGEDQDSLNWDIQGWVGTDENKAWLKTEGEKILGGDLESAQAQLLYSRNISDFFDLQAGLRQDFKPEPERTFAVLGFQGLAPQWFEVNLASFLSDDGDLSARVEAEYELLLTQKLVLQPSLEVNAAFQEVPNQELGSGFNDLELGLRLRYEIEREFAPYAGLQWERKLGETADMARAEGEEVSATALVAGISFWF
ncbi:copper resistance protein B [Aestuariispira insulae]|uniref:Copper resistance protein B n=1 Tax=Aestuariispira insulae TaxID=1461337 RepID=A0A3D9HE75_9PROT|nr:copper resistance protein B [Aestuariispira insulae]RED47774.1 copper resistance protein B [Aestuariispira insulae]